ncbi:hypothetical protein [Sphingomonas sp. Leaf21]|uniref:hypothetical protein n=1 Tax=Sphingomonas sp. Leaf21 TaxID=2876550 RepID=UPI001E415387|nr:hypothetical protein [Sphingomonas sp. Leaf21]
MQIDDMCCHFTTTLNMSMTSSSLTSIAEFTVIADRHIGASRHLFTAAQGVIGLVPFRCWLVTNEGDAARGSIGSAMIVQGVGGPRRRGY